MKIKIKYLLLLFTITISTIFTINKIYFTYSVLSLIISSYYFLKNITKDNYLKHKNKSNNNNNNYNELPPKQTNSYQKNYIKTINKYPKRNIKIKKKTKNNF